MPSHHPTFALNHALLAASSAEEEQDPHKASSIPPWVHINDDNEKAPFLEPEPAVPNTRHYKPPTKYSVGRKWDHVRDAEAPMLSAPIADAQALWHPFMQSGPNPCEVRGLGVVRSQSWMEQNMEIYKQGYRPEDEDDPEAAGKTPRGFKGIMYRGEWLISPERQEKTVKLFWKLLLTNAFVPLAFRLVVLAFSSAAVGVASTILHIVNNVNGDLDRQNQCAPRASTYMGIIVGAIAIPYVGYVTYDEYASKPLGLRSVAAKTMLLLCDLYFIVFSASNLSLAFSALLDRSWACFDERYQEIGGIEVPVPQDCPNNPHVCQKQKALTGVLAVSLIAWLLCFSISVLRVVEKLRLDY